MPAERARCMNEHCLAEDPTIGPFIEAMDADDCRLMLCRDCFRLAAANEEEDPTMREEH